jgi:hypothetical protein
MTVGPSPIAVADTLKNGRDAGRVTLRGARP